MIIKSKNVWVNEKFCEAKIIIEDGIIKDVVSYDDDVVDMIEDGEYIYASFMKDYGIDLLAVDMHWHVFKALFSSLSDDTKIAKIMSMRGYKKSNKTIDEQYSELKRVWQLPTKISEADIELLEYFNSL